jgi:hypothetical protein
MKNLGIYLFVTNVVLWSCLGVAMLIGNSLKSALDKNIQKEQDINNRIENLENNLNKLILDKIDKSVLYKIKSEKEFNVQATAYSLPKLNPSGKILLIYGDSVFDSESNAREFALSHHEQLKNNFIKELSISKTIHEPNIANCWNDTTCRRKYRALYIDKYDFALTISRNKSKELLIGFTELNRLVTVQTRDADKSYIDINYTKRDSLFYNGLVIRNLTSFPKIKSVSFKNVRTSNSISYFINIPDSINFIKRKSN